jgi:hypothetical protein
MPTLHEANEFIAERMTSPLEQLGAIRGDRITLPRPIA